jgi:hypothetical protein
VRDAQANGDLTIKTTSRVVNAALLGFGQVRHAGFAKGKKGGGEAPNTRAVGELDHRLVDLSRAERLGAHEGDVANTRVKRIPPAANWSKLGVSTSRWP